MFTNKWDHKINFQLWRFANLLCFVLVMISLTFFFKNRVIHLKMTQWQWLFIISVSFLLASDCHKERYSVSWPCNHSHKHLVHWLVKQVWLSLTQNLSRIWHTVLSNLGELILHRNIKTLCTLFFSQVQCKSWCFMCSVFCLLCSTKLRKAPRAGNRQIVDQKVAAW